MNKIALQRGGKCLSSAYLHSQKKLTFQCSNDHVWQATPNKIQQGRWCPECRKTPLKEILKIIEANNWEVKYDQYVGLKTQLKLKCNKGHAWSTTAANIKYGQGCPFCSSNRLCNEVFEKISKRWGGRVLSKFKSSHDVMRFLCANNHEFESLAKHVKRGSWCPHCKNKGESICRAIFEFVFQRKFTKVRPPWLVSPDGHKLELDGYCEELLLAFEHQGSQHDSADHFFNQNNLAAHDLHKIEVCKDRGITLIHVPSVYEVLGLSNAIPFITGLIEENTGVVSDKFSLDALNISPSDLDYINSIARERGGHCLSKSFLGMHRKHSFKCGNGHEWGATPTNIKRGAWCPFCYNKKTIRVIRQHIANMPVECFSKEYINSKTKLSWRCMICNGEWQRSWRNMLRTPRCLHCKNVVFYA